MLTFSNSHLWINCAQSCNPDRAFDAARHQETDAQREGTAAHWVANCILRGDATDAAEMIGKIAPNGWPIEPAMARHVQSYVEIVTRHGRVASECDLQLFGGLVRGRDDAHTIDDGSSLLRLYDLKYGFRLVEPDENWPTILAALALVKPHHTLISLEIFQPRAAHPRGPHRKHIVDLATLDDYRAQAEKAVHAAYADKPAAVPGDHCRHYHCPRVGVCTALANTVYQMFEIAADTRRAHKLTAEQLGAEGLFLRKAEKLIAARAAGVEAEIDARLMAGEFIPGWMTRQKQTKRVIAKPDMVKMLTGHDPYKQTLKSPAELENEGADPKLLAICTEKPFGGFEITPYDPKSVARAFKK